MSSDFICSRIKQIKQIFLFWGQQLSTIEDNFLFLVRLKLSKIKGNCG